MGHNGSPVSLIQPFRLLAAKNQKEEFVQYFYAWWRTTQQTFLKRCIKIPAMKQQLKPMFMFPINYMSMDTLT